MEWLRLGLMDVDFGSFFLLEAEARNYTGHFKCDCVTMKIL